MTIGLVENLQGSGNVEDLKAIVEGVDEIALGLTVDAFSRTALCTVAIVGRGARPSQQAWPYDPSANVEPGRCCHHMLPRPRSDAPALTMETALAQIDARFDRPTAAIVALVMEYPWVTEATPTTR
jgi:hypothetical protein